MKDSHGLCNARAVTCEAGLTLGDHIEQEWLRLHIFVSAFEVEFSFL